MTKELIEKYGIDFKNSILDNFGFPASVDKIPNTNLGCLTSLLYEISVKDINNSLLPDIEEALAEPNSEIENGSGFVDITIYQDVVRFYPALDDKIYSMPTIDFKKIVIGWRDFLLTPPLNGAQV